MKVTVTVQIGNSDDRLSNLKWSGYCRAVAKVLNWAGFDMHFSGGSAIDSHWENAAWVFVTDEKHLDQLKPQLVKIRKRFDQVSLAITVGKTEMI